MIIQSKKVWMADQFVAAQIEMKDGKITNLYEYGKYPVDYDYGNDWILPGFIDVHCHGAYGFDTNDAQEEMCIRDRVWCSRCKPIAGCK